MKLIIQVQALPTLAQETALLETMYAFNAAASVVAQRGFASAAFTQVALHKQCYYDVRQRFGLSAQLAVRAIGKAVETFQRDRSRCPVFSRTSAVVYDARILTWYGAKEVSVLTLQGRQRFPVVYGNYQAQFLPYVRGQTDLVYRKGLFFLYCTIVVPDAEPYTPTRVLGVDLGIVNVAMDSDGNSYTGAVIDAVRTRSARHRKTYQATNTKSAKRRLKKLAGQQARFQRAVNHTVSKRVVTYAQDTNAAIALEDLTGIRDRTTVRKTHRDRHSNWSFRQLRQFIGYKAQRQGVPVVFVDPRNTSRQCSTCGAIDKRNRRSQADFCCLQCGFTTHADLNAARNIATRALVTAPD